MAKGYKKARTSGFYWFRRYANDSFLPKIAAKLAYKRRLLLGTLFMRKRR
jgi:hypothetical protein